MRPLVGLGLDGASYTPRHLSLPAARLGEPVWGPRALLRDLELRLALTAVTTPASVRTAHYAARMARLGETDAFYSASFAADALGTANTLLGWRDGLVDAGWEGGLVTDGGERLAALSRLESGDERVAAGEADRVAAVLAALRESVSRIYDGLLLADEASQWSRRWQDVFDTLARQGTEVAPFHVEVAQPRSDSDLGRLQRALRNPGQDPNVAAPVIRGDGSVRVFRGETPADLSALAASLIAATPQGTLVVRSGDTSPLEEALSSHGQPRQGLASSSAWRPAMQILRLAIELAFEPRDPHRALELLALPVGPFRGALGIRLAKALTRSPGIGGREWTQQKEAARDFLHSREVRTKVDAGATASDALTAADAYVNERLERLADWLEQPGVSASGASPAHFLVIAERVRAWLDSRLATAPDVYAPAIVQAKAFISTLRHETRVVLSREAVRQLLDTVVSAPHDHERSVENAGRVPHVWHPSALLASCETIVFWNFVAGAYRGATVAPWNRAELDALAIAGVHIGDPAKSLRRESDAWRRAVLCARKSVVFFVPQTIAGGASGTHPLWDEICARLELDAIAEARVTARAGDLLDSQSSTVPMDILAALPLPDAPRVWKLGSDLSAGDPGEVHAITSLETLASCPLRWILERRAELGSGAVARIASDSLLYGNLGHRLVEELFLEGAFDLEEAAYDSRATSILDRLVRMEAATLLLPGMSFERAQLVPQLLRTTRELRRYLARAGFRVVGVEEFVETDSEIGVLRGRLDVRLVGENGEPAVLDLKWGEARYRDVVRQGRAIQLALYARAIATKAAPALPPAGYFALRSGRVVTTDPRLHAERVYDGEDLDATLDHVTRTTRAVVASLRRGEAPAPGIRRALPLLESVGVAESERDRCYVPKPDAACGTCSYGSLCGRGWEAFAL